MVFEEVPPILDLLAKLYELWNLHELTLEPEDTEFLRALSDEVYSRDKPHTYAFTEDESNRLEECWKQYMETL